MVRRRDVHGRRRLGPGSVSLLQRGHGVLTAYPTFPVWEGGQVGHQGDPPGAKDAVLARRFSEVWLRAKRAPRFGNVRLPRLRRASGAHTPAHTDGRTNVLYGAVLDEPGAGTNLRQIERRGPSAGLERALTGLASIQSGFRFAPKTREIRTMGREGERLKDWVGMGGSFSTCHP